MFCPAGDRPSVPEQPQEARPQRTGCPDEGPAVLPACVLEKVPEGKASQPQDQRTFRHSNLTQALSREGGSPPGITHSVSNGAHPADARRRGDSRVVARSGRMGRPEGKGIWTGAGVENRAGDVGTSLPAHVPWRQPREDRRANRPCGRHPSPTGAHMTCRNSSKITVALFLVVMIYTNGGPDPRQPTQGSQPGYGSNSRQGRDNIPPGPSLRSLPKAVLGRDPLQRDSGPGPALTLYSQAPNHNVTASYKATISDILL